MTFIQEWELAESNMKVDGGKAIAFKGLSYKIRVWDHEIKYVEGELNCLF